MGFKDTAVIAVRAAGKILVENLNKEREVRFKTHPHDYVTDLDIQSENQIKEILKKTFPEHSIVAEESEIEEKSSLYTWFIDPLSSTANYIHNFPHFAVAVALRSQDEFILGVVYDPFFDELFWAEKDKGAFLNDRQIYVSKISNINDAMILPVMHSTDTAEYIRKILSLGAGGMRHIGSTSLQLCYIACGRAEAHINNDSDIFAIPAGKVILEEAGGRVSDFQNQDWNLASKTILASNSRVGSDLVKVLNNE